MTRTTETAAPETRSAARGPGGRPGGVGAFLKGHLREYGMLLALFAIMLFFQAATDGTLMRPVNLTNLFLQNSYIIIMALGMLLVIVAGHIDLSVGSVVAFVGGLAAVMVVHWGWPTFVVVPVCLIAGIVIGAAQGYWIAYWKIPSFIVTLAGMLVFRGLTLWLLEGQSVGPFPPSFQQLSTGFVGDVFTEGRPNWTAALLGAAGAAAIVWMAARARGRRVRYGIEDEPLAFFFAKNGLVAAAMVYVAWLLATYRGLPNVLITMAALICAYTFLMNSTVVGRRIYAIGGNYKA
ncbi:MAG: sugar ABC transporter permease, partial [Pseudomonadota bacterium]|nr:sugar ABC transporter permease [Pseudomonadota bacterium]